MKAEAKKGVLHITPTSDDERMILLSTVRLKSIVNGVVKHRVAQVVIEPTQLSAHETYTQGVERKLKEEKSEYTYDPPSKAIIDHLAPPYKEYNSKQPSIKEICDAWLERLNHQKHDNTTDGLKKAKWLIDREISLREQD